jgi:hypothetical protein
MLVADWLVACGWPDPAKGHREGVADEPTAPAILNAGGGLERFARTQMADAGLRLLTNPVCRGDVGLVTVVTPSGPSLAAGVWTGRRWAVRAPRGIWIGRAQCRVAWLV